MKARSSPSFLFARAAGALLAKQRLIIGIFTALILLVTPTTDSVAAERPHESLRRLDEITEIVDEKALASRGATQSVKEYVQAYFEDVPVMAKIAWCESKFVHTDENGTVLRGEVTPEDVGVMQINEYFHGKTARILEINLHTLDGNLEYAQYLYEREGTTPWNASRHCWKRPNHVALK